MLNDFGEALEIEGCGDASEVVRLDGRVATVERTKGKLRTFGYSGGPAAEGFKVGEYAYTISEELAALLATTYPRYPAAPLFLWVR